MSGKGCSKLLKLIIALIERCEFYLVGNLSLFLWLPQKAQKLLLPLNIMAGPYFETFSGGQKVITCMPN